MTVKKRRDLVVDGYPYTKLCFIKDGMAARYKVLRNGKRQIVDVLVPGDVVGLPGSFLDRAAFSVIALTDMKLEVCSLDAFINVCYRRPKFALALSWLAVERRHHSCRAHRRYRPPHADRAARPLPAGAALAAADGRPRRADGVRPADLAGGDERHARPQRSASQPHAHQAAQRAHAVVADRRVQFTDIKALEVLAHFQSATLARIPAPIQREQELIA